MRMEKMNENIYYSLTDVKKMGKRRFWNMTMPEKQPDETSGRNLRKTTEVYYTSRQIFLNKKKTNFLTKE